MNDTFSLRRFGKYFLYDLNSASANFGLSLIICGCIPILSYVMTVLFNLIFMGSMPEMSGHSIQVFKYVTLFVGVAVACMAFGPKVYGKLTDKRAGSDYLCIPASVLEKFLSMVIISCVVVPAVLLVVYALNSLVLNIFIPEYGALIPALTMSSIPGLAEVADEISLNIPAALWMNWIENVLFFVLGAIIFKKAKVGKTILAIFALSMIVSVISSFIFVRNGFGITTEMIETWAENLTAEKVQLYMNLFINALYTIIIGGLLAGIYFRIKTLKH